jgi:integrase/recombinase XerD
MPLRNTGARVQEIVTLCIRDLQLEALPQVRLYGKGRKERWCPLWPQTAETLRAWLAEPGRDISPDRPVFCNHRGDRLTRFGVRYLLRKYCARAKVTMPSLGQKRLPRTVCATAPLSICFAQVWRSQLQVNGWATPV